MAHVRAFNFRSLRSTGLGLGVSILTLAWLGATPAAATTYIYTGNPFVVENNPALGDAIAVSVTLDTPSNFPGSVSTSDVEALSISSGPLTLSGPEDSLSLTLLNGAVQFWSVGGVGPEGDPQLHTQFSQNGNTTYFEEFVVTFIGPNDFNGSGQGVTGTAGVGTPGTWNLQAAVPEPATWAMMLVGFAGLGYALRRQRAAVAA